MPGRAGVLLSCGNTLASRCANSGSTAFGVGQMYDDAETTLPKILASGCLTLQRDGPIWLVLAR